MGDRSPKWRQISHGDVELGSLAARQHGNVTRQQLLGRGLGPKAIAYRVRIGRLYPVHPGVYSVGRPPVTALERAYAAVLACGPGAALSHGSAMTLWGFWKRWQPPHHVTVASDRRPRGIAAHRSRTLAAQDVTTQLGIRVTSPARTLLDSAPEMTDRNLVRAVNDALLTPYLQRSELAELVRRCRWHRAAGRLMPYLTADGGPTRSQFEDLFTSFCRRYDLPEPLINVTVAGYEVDAAFARERVIVELDGYAFHSSRRAFEGDRDRDADTLAAGWETVRTTWERFHATPGAEAVRLQAILRARRGFLRFSQTMV